jgi:glycosyltransferase involved in cell wall biosynthesis
MKVFVAMPAYNVEKTLVQTFEALPPALREHIILGNNQSEDGTAELAKKLGIDVITHDKNYGYGGNLKRIYKEALRRGADIVVEVHPDYQYEPSLADMLVEYIKRGHYDVIQANRIRSRDESLAGGMPAYRYFGNRVLTFFENVWFGVTFGEWHSGMRAYRREVLEALPLDSYPDTHAFASDILMDCVMYGFRVGEVPVPVRYEKQSSSVNVPGLFAYAARTVGAAMKRPPWKKRRFGSGRSVPPPPPALSVDKSVNGDERLPRASHHGA